MNHRRTNDDIRERGQSLVETALGMMVVLAVLAGMVDFGLAFGHRIALTNASRSGARFASRYPKLETNINMTIIEALRGTFVLPEDYDHFADANEDLRIEVVCVNGIGPVGCEYATRGDQVQVTVSYDYRPIFGGILGVQELLVGSSTIMNVLGPDEL